MRQGGQSSSWSIEQGKYNKKRKPDIAPETAVLCRRPPTTLLEHPPKRTTPNKIDLNVCSHLSVSLAVGLPGMNKTLAQPKLRPPNLGARPRKPKTSFGTKIHDKELCRLESVPAKPAEVVSLKLLIPKLYFEAKTPAFVAVFYSSTCFS